MPSDEVGLAILGPLRELDEVAYLRFASVYQAFSSIDDFEKAIADLRAEHRRSSRHPTAGHRSTRTSHRQPPHQTPHTDGTSASTEEERP